MIRCEKPHDEEVLVSFPIPGFKLNQLPKGKNDEEILVQDEEGSC